MNELQLLDTAKEIFIKLKKDGFDEYEIKQIVLILKAISDIR